VDAPLYMMIVGGGFGGLGAAIRSRVRGDDNFLLVEQAGGVGDVVGQPLHGRGLRHPVASVFVLVRAVCVLDA
jgi:thioredoxin reductase